MMERYSFYAKIFRELVNRSYIHKDSELRVQKAPNLVKNI